VGATLSLGGLQVVALRSYLTSAGPTHPSRVVSKAPTNCHQRCGSEEGQCFEVLASEMGDRERVDLWESVLLNLAERGLNREAVELGIMDGLPGLEAIFKCFFPRAQTQCCQKHAKASTCRRVRVKEREPFCKDRNKVFYAANESAARVAFFPLKEQ
jgi:putative transposase